MTSRPSVRAAAWTSRSPTHPLPDHMGRFAAVTDRVHRTKGTVNHLTRELKQVILDAAENVGNEMTIADPRGPMGITGYLENIAREHPAVMCGMLARLVPIQQESTQTVDVTYHSFEEINNRLRELGLPVGRIYPLLEAKPVEPE